MLRAWQQSQIVRTTYPTLSPKTHYCGIGLPCATRRGGFIGTVLWVQSAITKDAEYLGRNDPRVSGIPHSLAVVVKITWLGMKCCFPVRYIRSASFGSRESIRVHI